MIDFCIFSGNLAALADEGRMRLAKVVSILGGESQHIAQFERAQQNPQPSLTKLRSFSEYQSETMVMRAVDNFLSMLSETIQACMLKRPELLRSNEQVKTEDVLRFTKRRDLVDFLVNRKMNALSYAGLSAIEEFITDRLNITLIENDEERASVAVAIELRNIYTHNRGVVNELFLSRLSKNPAGRQFELGEAAYADLTDIVDHMNVMFEIARRLDIAALKKFRIQKKKFLEWDSARVAFLKEEADKLRASYKSPFEKH